MLACVAKYIALSAICMVFLDQGASAQDCRNYLQAARADIGKQVAAMQRLEHEASDRAKGLDSRPFDFLAGDVGKTAALITDPALKPKGSKDGAKDCRDPAHPVRRICLDAAQAWV